MRNHDSADQYLQKANELAQDEKFNAAFREFKRAIQLDYGYARAHAEFGLALHDAGRYPEAVERFREAVKIDPKYPFEVTKLSTALDRNVRQREDITQFQKVVDASDDAGLFHRWGQVLASISHHDEAIEQFKKALAKNPKLDVNIESLHNALDGSETTEQQVKSFQEEVDKLQNPLTWNTWGKTLLALSRYPAAMEQFKKAVAVQDQWAEAYYNWGEALYNLNAYQEAVAKYRKAVQQESGYVLAYLYLGLALNKLERYQEASENYQLGMDKAPSVEYLDPWQEAIRQLPLHEPAISQYQHALEKNYPNWKEVYYKDVYFEAGAFLMGLSMRAESAPQYARSLATFSPLGVSWETPLALQEILAVSPDPEDTMSRIQKVFEEVNQPELYLQWGVILARMNYNDRAFEQLSHTLQILSSKHEDWPWEWIKPLIPAFQTPENRLAAHKRVQNVLERLNKPHLWVEWGGVSADGLQTDRQALAPYRRALLLDPYTPHLFEAFTEALRRLPDQSAVLQEVQAEVESASRPEVTCTWGRILDALGKKNVAIGLYQQAVRLKHDFVEAYYALGQLYTRQGRHREACGQFQKAVEYGQGHAEPIFDWGTALLKTGRQEEALQKYLQAIRTKPSAINERLQSVQDLLKWDDTVVARFQSMIDEVQTAESRTRWGTFLIRIERYELSLQQHQQAVEQDPDLLESYRNWRKAMGKAGISTERIRDYDRAIEKHRNNADAYWEWGHFLFNLNRYEQAAEKCQKALEKDTKYSVAHAFWIRCLLNLNDIKRVREEAQRLLSYNNDWYGYYYLVWAAFLDGKYDEAIQQSELGIQNVGFHLALYVRWAWALYKSGRVDLALRKLEEATHKDPNNPAGYFEYGTLLLVSNHYEEAATQFQKAIKLKPDDPFAYHNLAAIRYNQGQYQEAWIKGIDALKAYKRLEPALVRVVDNDQYVEGNEFYYHAGVVQTIQHNIEEAEAILNEGLAFDPQNTRILGGLAGLHWEQKEECLGSGMDISRQKSAYHWRAMEYFRRAERLLKERSDRYPNYDVRIELGDLYLTVEEYDKARGCFEEARSKDETVALPYAKLGVIHLRQKQPDKAIPLLQEALRRNPDDLEMQSSLAEANLRAEKLNEAEAANRQILAIAPNHVQSLIGLGEICTAQGEKKDTDRFSEAIEYFSKALEVAEQEKIRSKYLKYSEKGAIYYSLGYARVQLYEKSGIHREISVLKQALQDFRKCREFDPTHQKAIRAIEKIEDRMGYFSPQRLTETIGPLSIFTMSVIIFVAVQFTFFISPIFNRPSLSITETSLQTMAKQLPQELLQKLEPLKNQKFSSEEALLNALQPLVESKQLETVKNLVLKNISTVKTAENFPTIEIGYYSILTFSSLLFMVVGLYLPQVLKLSVAGIVLEKSSIDQAQAGGTLGINR